MREWLSETDLKNRLKTLSIICDTREQVNDHVIKYFDSKKIPYTSRKLDCGDYSAMLGGSTLENDIAIERKHSLDEIAGNFTVERERFEKEFLRAYRNGTKIYLIIEDSSWMDIFCHNYCSKLDPKAFAASLFSWMEKYNITVEFCDKSQTGQLIYGHLFYKAREELQNGNKR